MIVANDLKEKIAGEIALSDSPGSTMKKWRELFGITQVELAHAIKVSTSTISDYESNRRLSPGVGVIKRFVDALFALDEAKGNIVTQSLGRFMSKEEEESPIYKIHDFIAPISGVDFSRIIEGKIIANPNYLDNIKLFGYTIVDSLKIILNMQPSEYPKLFGSTSERVFIFEHVSSGRSPMVVIRVAPIKPKLVVLHNITNVDELAIKIAKVEKIPLITTKLDIKEIESRLNKI